MDYYINPLAVRGSFTVPIEVADKHLKLAGAVQLKVILYMYRHITDKCTSLQISEFLRLPEADINDALQYWVQAGIILCDGATPSATAMPEPAKTVKQVIKPSREDIVDRCQNNEKFQSLLQEAQVKFGRLLKFNETSTLLWLLEDHGMDVSVILMVIEYAISVKKCNISFIERTAIDWINKGITDIVTAESHTKRLAEQHLAWKIVSGAFGLDDRVPSTKELEYSELWVTEWKFDKEVLRLAYEKCVDAKSKFIMGYVAKIIEAWHKNGYKTVDEIKAAEAKEANLKSGKNNFSTHDIVLVEQLINKGYTGD